MKIPRTCLANLLRYLSFGLHLNSPALSSLFQIVPTTRALLIHQAYAERRVDVPVLLMYFNSDKNQHVHQRGLYLELQMSVSAPDSTFPFVSTLPNCSTQEQYSELFGVCRCSLHCRHYLQCCDWTVITYNTILSEISVLVTMTT